MTLAAFESHAILASAGGKPGYQNTDEPPKPGTDQPPQPPQEIPDQRGPDPDSRPPERASR